jgi:hypothetical protein
VPALVELEKQGVTAVKERASIMNCSPARSQNLLTINFVNDDYEEKMWTFKFNSHKLAEKWVALFQEVQEKCVARSIKSKDSKSTGFASEYSSILQNISLMDSFSAEKE